jgi:hypothetical protein
MIDIARAMLPGGNVGQYHIGCGVSAPVLANFALTASQFVDVVREAGTDAEVARQLSPRAKRPPRLLDGRLRALTVADVPEAQRAEFYHFYGADLRPDCLVFDILEADDARKLPKT